MTDCNTNKMDAQAQVEPYPDDSGTLPSATPPSGCLPMGAEALACLPNGANVSALADVTPLAKPLLGVATPAPLEEDLRDLAARNPVVQLTETHLTHVRAPALTSLPVLSGSQDQQEALSAYRDGNASYAYCRGDRGTRHWGSNHINGAPIDAHCYHPQGGKGSCGQCPG